MTMHRSFARIVGITHHAMDFSQPRALQKCVAVASSRRPFTESPKNTAARSHSYRVKPTIVAILALACLATTIIAPALAQQPNPALLGYNVGQQGDPFQASLTRRVSPPAANGPVVPLAYQAEPAQPLAVPPPDPAPPKWGTIESPEVVVQVPVREYLLAGPARGVFQHEAGQEYTRSVIDPYGVMMADTQYNVAIDLYRPDGIAPAGVVGDHTLKGGGTVLVSYRMQVQEFHDVFSGTHRVGNADVLSAFAFSPTRASIQKHIIQMEYAPTDDLTLMAYLPFYQNSIDFVDATGAATRTSFTNPGDIPVSLMYVLKRWNRQQIHLNFGMSIPFGFLDSQTDIPTPTSPNLTYALRTSSGSWEMLPGLTYRGQSDNWTWGLQSIEDVRMGRNRLSYTLGNVYDVTGWASRRWTERFATSARLDSRVWGSIRGADPRLNQGLSPMNRPDLQRGERVDLLFGLNYYGLDRILPGQRVSVEAGAPVYQHLRGPQLGTNWLLNFNWSIMF
jgi:hypothetical protein